MRRSLRPVVFAALVTVGLLGADSSSAVGAVTIGQTATVGYVCGHGDNIVQTGVQAAPDYAVPAGYGVITSWSTQATGTGKLIVMRPGTASNQFSFVGKSQTEILDGTLATFPVRIAVQPGDRIGMRMDTSGAGCLFAGAPGDMFRFGYTPSDPVDGSSQLLDLLGGSRRISVSAKIEPDCDGDGLGDETQDTNTSTCVTGQRAAALKKCKKKHSKKARKKCRKKAALLPA